MALPPLRLPSILRFLVVAGLASVALGQLGSVEANRAAKAAQAALAASNGPRAVDLARHATTVDPGRAVYWNDLGRSLELVPDLPAARAAYRQATSRSPYTPAFWWNLGRMEQEFAKQNEPGARDAAYEVMRRAIAANPHNPESFDRFSRIQLGLGDTAGAIDVLRSGIVATDSNELRVALARRLIEATRIVEARQVLRDVLAKEPTNTAALDLQKQIGAQ
jgi:Flp pilus assembly protein TadD